MQESTIDWMVSEIIDYSDRVAELQKELNSLKGNIEDIILNPTTTDAQGNRLTGSQVKDQQIKAIADLVFPPKIRPMMGLFMDTEHDLSQLKIGFNS